MTSCGRQKEEDCVASVLCCVVLCCALFVLSVLMAVEHALLYSTLPPPPLPHSRIILNVYATAALAVDVAVRCGGSIRNNNKKNTPPPAAQSKKQEQSRVKHSHAFSTHTQRDTQRHRHIALIYDSYELLDTHAQTQSVMVRNCNQFVYNGGTRLCSAMQCNAVQGRDRAGSSRELNFASFN